MNIKLFDSEIKVMEVLWKEGDLTAKQLADILSEKDKAGIRIQLIL